jgi:hypothetical protein
MKTEKFYDASGNLEKWARERFPQAGQLVYSWSGMVRPAPSLHLSPRLLSMKQTIYGTSEAWHCVLLAMSFECRATWLPASTCSVS